MSYSLGVDLGTTFVAAAVAHDSQVEMFTLGDRSVVSPSAVYVREDGTMITGDAAVRQAVAKPDRVGREFKRRLGDPIPVILGGVAHSVTNLLGAVLRDVVAVVRDTEGAPPASIVLTHPANWGPFRRELFDEVPELAGLTGADAVPLRTVTEPEGAAAHYAASRRLAEGDVVAVYDLGGGTFDATVLRKQGDGIEILGTPEGIERLGGVDFDEAILAHVNFQAGGALTELDMGDLQTSVAMARLRQDCVLAKEALSIDSETTIPVFLPHRHFEVRLAADEFESMIRAQIESTIGALTRTLRSAHVAPDELSAVLLVGGSSRIPLVGRMLSESLGRPIVVDTHPKYAVALGAAELARADRDTGARPDRGASWSDAPAVAGAGGAAGSAAAAGAAGAAGIAGASGASGAPGAAGTFGAAGAAGTFGAAGAAGTFGAAGAAGTFGAAGAAGTFG
ncbi:Hsp70 family protein, partial [Pseudonocardia kongjuensis]|uniref:Hsp70 family protein n=1 Tax=Pseudonocardia kongjuensis TaxID=102227 RepID=UPI0031CE1BCD